MSDIAIQIEGLGKKYTLRHERAGYKTFRETLVSGAQAIARRIRHPFSTRSSEDAEEFWALKDVNLEIRQGERIGIIGRNGAGKSTLLKILSRITEPTTGRVIIHGRVASLLEVGTGFHPELTGRENIYLNGAILGMRRSEIKRKFDEIVDFSGVEKFIDTPVKRYSSGMYVRLAFAVAAHLEPEILIVDEVLAVGDAEFQKKCMGKMEDVSTREGRTVLFVSHNMGSVANLCHRGIFMSAGQIAFSGTANQAIAQYMASLQVENTNIAQSANRSGNGIVRFTDFYIEDASGQKVALAFTGQTIRLVFELETHEPAVDDIDIGFSIHDSMDSGVAILYSSYQGAKFSFSHRGRKLIRCEIQSLALVPGTYIVRGRVLVKGFEADWLKDHLGRFTVEAGDFYGTGKVDWSQAVTSSGIKTLLRGSWVN
jgi:lipopolysaccharide transport system ATP-binding protein